MPMDNNKDIVIAAKNLSADYGSRTIWQGAGFSIEKGQFVAVLGPNGAGKTTLFRLLLWLGPAAKRVFVRVRKNPDAR